MLAQQVFSLTLGILAALPWFFILKCFAYFWLCSFLLIITLFATGDIEKLSEEFPKDVDQDLF